MDEHHNWYNESVWHIHWPYQVYVGQWPIFYGPAILLHILKTVWWGNIVLGILDHCDSKIDLVKYVWVSDLYFMVHWFYLISLSDFYYFYTLRNGTGWGYSCPSGHLLWFMYFFVCCCFRYLANKLYNDTFPWWKDANLRTNYTWKFLSLLFSSVCLRCGLILINGFRFNEKYLIGKRVPEQKPHEMTSQNCTLIGYSTHVASNFIMRGIKKLYRKVMLIIFTKIFHNLTVTIHKHIDHIWLKFLTSSLSYGNC